MDTELSDQSNNSTQGTHETAEINPEHDKIKRLPIYIHGNINHAKLLEVLKTKYQNNLHAKYTSSKLKISFQNIEDFKEFKELCQLDNVQYHTYSISTEKVLTVVLKGLVKFPEKTIINDLKIQGVNPIDCTEIPISIRYPIIYRVTFAPGTTLARVNHVRFIKNIKIYWGKYETRKPVIQCYWCQVHGHSSTNCNKNARSHDTRTCVKTLDVPPTCANCKEAHPANFSKCPCATGIPGQEKHPHGSISATLSCTTHSLTTRLSWTIKKTTAVPTSGKPTLLNSSD